MREEEQRRQTFRGPVQQQTVPEKVCKYFSCILCMVQGHGLSQQLTCSAWKLSTTKTTECAMKRSEKGICEGNNGRESCSPEKTAALV